MGIVPWKPTRKQRAKILRGGRPELVWIPVCATSLATDYFLTARAAKRWASDKWPGVPFVVMKFRCETPESPE